MLRLERMEVLRVGREAGRGGSHAHRTFLTSLLSALRINTVDGAYLALKPPVTT